MTRLFAIILALTLSASQAFAAACYTPVQYRAEQAIRYHTRLMIIGMRCQRVLAAPTAYLDYNAFTKRNQAVIREQENQLISHFKARRFRSPEKQLHTLRTDLANSMSMQANGPAVIQFCRNYAGTLQQAKAMKAADFRKWITRVDLKIPGVSTQPLCAAAQRKR